MTCILNYYSLDPPSFKAIHLQIMSIFLPIFCLKIPSLDFWVPTKIFVNKKFVYFGAIVIGFREKHFYTLNYNECERTSSILYYRPIDNWVLLCWNNLFLLKLCIMFLLMEIRKVSTLQGWCVVWLQSSQQTTLPWTVQCLRYCKTRTLKLHLAWHAVCHCRVQLHQCTLCMQHNLCNVQHCHWYIFINITI